MGIIAGAVWLFNLGAVLGGYLVLLVLASLAVRRYTNTALLLRLTLLSALFGLTAAYFLLDQLARSYSAKELYIFTAFTEITWRPAMQWLFATSVVCFALGYLQRQRKGAFLLINGIAMTCLYAGLIQAVVGLFFANDFFRAYGFTLHY